MTVDQAQVLVAKLGDLNLNASSEERATTQQEALRLSKELVLCLQEPESVAIELAYATFIPMGARIAVDLKLFDYIVDNGRPITVSHLATLSGAEELFIKRILRPLAGAGFVKEVDEEIWEATPVSEAMTKPGVAAGHRMLFEMLSGAAVKAPRYFKESGYRCPINPCDGLIQYAHQTKLQSFEFFSIMPHIIHDFNIFMGNTMGARTYWVDWFPVMEQILDGASKDSALIVDVGGGKGHDLQIFHQKFPGEWKLILQDLPHVLTQVGDLNSTVERLGHDFFTPQPIHDARVYFYHHILHDWSDYKCLEILEGLKSAMKPGYSKLLLHEMIIPEKGATNFHAILDLTMMGFNSGQERTEKEWRKLLTTAGFKDIKVWLSPQEDADGMVEAMLNI